LKFKTLFFDLHINIIYNKISILKKELEFIISYNIKIVTKTYYKLKLIVNKITNGEMLFKI
jgi:hypothetical protein